MSAHPTHDALTKALAEAQAEIERLEAIVEVLAAKARAARWNVTEDGALVRLCRGEHEKSAACTGHEESFVPLARATAAEAERDALREALTALLRHDFADQCQECGIGQSAAWRDARAALAKTETAKPRPRVVTVPFAGPHCSWKAYCPERPDLGKQFGATEAEALAAMEAALAKTECGE